LQPIGITVRRATAADAAAIGDMIKDFQAYLRSLGDKTKFAFDAHAYVSDGFGANPAFAAILAEVDGTAAGYLLYHHGYDTDRGQRLTYVIDLYVQDRFRRRGVGKALMQAAARSCTEAAGTALIWTVYRRSQLAFDFYDGLGARRLSHLELMVWPVRKP
jgi:GNAT superfamily N-acetyltransferase